MKTMAARKNKFPSFENLQWERGAASPHYRWAPEELAVLAVLGSWILLTLAIWLQAESP